MELGRGKGGRFWLVGIGGKGEKRGKDTGLGFN